VARRDQSNLGIPAQAEQDGPAAGDSQRFSYRATGL
jgi:hypothetical protein